MLCDRLCRAHALALCPSESSVIYVGQLTASGDDVAVMVENLATRRYEVVQALVDPYDLTVSIDTEGLAFPQGHALVIRVILNGGGSVTPVPFHPFVMDGTDREASEDECAGVLVTFQETQQPYSEQWLTLS